MYGWGKEAREYSEVNEMGLNELELRLFELSYLRHSVAGLLSGLVVNYGVDAHLE